MRRVACVIPALDAAAMLSRIVGRIRVSVPHAIVVVVDDGSTDATAQIASDCADVVACHGQNLGKGAALRTGISTALGLRVGLVATLDADGQHPPELLPSLLAASDVADIVIGARSRRGTSMPAQRRLSNWLSSRIVRTLAGCLISDSQSGFRVIRANVLERIRPVGDHFDFETDLLVRAGRAGFRIASVTIPTVYGAPSNFRPVRDTLLLARALLRLSLSASSP